MTRGIKPLSKGFIKSVEKLEKAEKNPDEEISFDRVGVYNGRLYKKNSGKYRFLTALSRFFGVRDPKVYREMNLLTKLSKLVGSSDAKLPAKTREYAQKILKSGSISLLAEMKNHPTHYSYWNVHHVYQILAANPDLYQPGSLDQLQDDVIGLFKTKIEASSDGRNMIEAFNSIKNFKDALKQKAKAELIPLLYEQIKQKLTHQTYPSYTSFIQYLSPYYPEKSRLGLVMELFAGQGNVQSIEGEGNDSKVVYGPADPREFTEGSAMLFKRSFPSFYWHMGGYHMKKGDQSLSQSSCEKLLPCLNFPVAVHARRYQNRNSAAPVGIRLIVNKNVDLQPAISSDRSILPPSWLYAALAVKIVNFNPKPTIIYSVSVNESRREEDCFLLIRQEDARIVITLEPLA